MSNVYYAQIFRCAQYTPYCIAPLVILWLSCDENHSQFVSFPMSCTSLQTAFPMQEPNHFLHCRMDLDNLQLEQLSVRTKTVAYIADLKVKRSSSTNLRTMSLTVGTLLYFDSIRKAQLSLLRWRAHKLRPNHELTQKHKRPHLAGS